MVAIDGRYLQRETYAARGIGRVLKELLVHLPEVAPDLHFVVVGAADLPFAEGAIPDAIEVATYQRPWAARRAPRVKLELLLEELAFQRKVRQLGARALLVPAAHTAFPWSSTPRVLLLLDAIPYVCPEAAPRGWGERSAHWLYRYGMPRCQRAVAISAASARDGVAALRIRPWRMRVAHLGVDTRFQPQAPTEIERVRAKLGLPPRFVLVLGGFDPRKNVPAFLTAFTKRLGEHPELHVVVAGRIEAHQRPELQRVLASIGSASERVRLCGHVPEADLPALLSAARVLAFPSRFEGFGLPVLEAMACGTPVVAFDNSALPEVIGDGGVLITDGDLDAFASGVQTLCCDDTLHARLSERGVARSKRFRWQHTACGVAEALREVRMKQCQRQDYR